MCEWKTGAGSGGKDAALRRVEKRLGAPRQGADQQQRCVCVYLLSFITETLNLTIDIFFKFNTHLREYKISIINYIKDVKKIIADNHNITHIKHSESEYIDNKYEIVKTYIKSITKIEKDTEKLILSEFLIGKPC